MATVTSGGDGSITTKRVENPKQEKSIVTRMLIRGTFSLTHFPRLVQLVKSLCPETGHLGEFRDYDQVYNPAPETKAPKNSIRLRTHLVTPYFSPHAKEISSSMHNASNRFSIIYLGDPERRVQAPCEKRSVTTVSVSADPTQLLSSLGCQFVYEYARKGVRYVNRAGLIVELYGVEKLRTPKDPKKTEPLTDAKDKHGVVEVYSDQGATKDQLFAFMSYLQPLVILRSSTQRRRP